MQGLIQRGIFLLRRNYGGQCFFCWRGLLQELKEFHPSTSSLVLGAGLTPVYTEEIPPKDRKPIQWKLLTDLNVNSLEEAIEKIGWYTQRWKIEMFHKILKSGCKAEESKLRTSERLANLISIFCIVSWRIFWMTMMHRVENQSPSSLALTNEECEILDQLIPDKSVVKKVDKILGCILKKSHNLVDT